MNNKNNIQIPTPSEHAYNLGWTSYCGGLCMSVNPYDLDNEEDQYNAWADGYTTAERVEHVDHV